MRPEFEAFLARLYTDAALRARFLANPREETSLSRLTADECAALERIDRVGLELAARSFAHKRMLKNRRRGWLTHVVSALRRLGRRAGFSVTS